MVSHDAKERAEALDAAVTAYDAARCAIHRDKPMSDRNRETIAPMIAAAVKAYNDAVAASPSAGEVAKLVEELRALAPNVPEGPWTYEPWHVSEGPPMVFVKEGWLLCALPADDHARWVALCSPENIAKILTALESLSRELAEARERVSILEALTATPLFSHRALTAKLCEIMATRFGVRFLDPPDGGDVPIHEQVERMADALATAQTHIAALEDAVRVKDEALRPFAEAYDKAVISGYPPCHFVGALEFTAARTALSTGEPHDR